MAVSLVHPFFNLKFCHKSSIYDGLFIFFSTFSRLKDMQEKWRVSTHSFLEIVQTVGRKVNIHSAVALLAWVPWVPKNPSIFIVL